MPSLERDSRVEGERLWIFEADWDSKIFENMSAKMVDSSSVRDCLPEVCGADVEERNGFEREGRMSDDFGGREDSLRT